MHEVFADTGFFIASLDPQDNLHSLAREVSKSLGRFRVVTTEGVLTELLNYFAEWGTEARRIAAAAVVRARSHALTTVVPQTSERFSLALKRYQERPDKGYSLTDCDSMLLMEERHIRDALSTDRHFNQAGFRALLVQD